MVEIVEILKQLTEKQSAIELELDNIRFGTRHVKVGLEGKVKLRLVHLQDAKPSKFK